VRTAIRRLRPALPVLVALGLVEEVEEERDARLVITTTDPDGLADVVTGWRRG